MISNNLYVTKMSFSSRWLLILGCQFLVHLQVDVNAASCNGQTLGKSPASKQGSLDGNSNTQYVLTDNDYESPCCGVVSSWKIYASGAGSVTFEVWRPQGGGIYTLIGQNTETVSGAGEFTYPINSGSRIKIIENDIIGFFNPGNTIVEHKDEGSGLDNNYYITGTTTSVVGDSVAPTNDVDERTYAIQATLDEGNTPSFTNLDGSTSISKIALTTSTPVYTVIATDDDFGDVLVYSLQSISPSSDFSVDATTGEVTATTTAVIIGDYTLDIRVTDDCGNEEDRTLTVSILNSVPVIHSLPVVLDLSESATDETLLHTVNATDADGEDITCSVSSSPSGPFFIKYLYIGGELVTGVYLQANPNLNYDVTSTYDVTVTCEDPNAASDSEILYVYLIQNNVPVITNLQNTTSITSTIPSNTEIFQVLATDAEGDQTSFTLTCTLVSPCPFTIYSTGAVYLTESLAGTSRNAYELDIAVSDDFSASGTHRLTIFVTDLNIVPEMSNLPASIQVNEDVTVGTTLFTVSVYDEDGDTGHTLSSTFNPSEGNALFSLNSTTGELILTTELNYLTQANSYTVTIDVSDAQSTSNSSTLTIDVIDVNTAPVLYQTNYMIESDEGPAGFILPDPGFNVYDKDGDTLTYAFDGGDSTNGFNINASTGIVSFTIDYDVDGGTLSTLSEWLIKVSDPEGLAVTATLTVSISDINDNAPLLSSTAYSATTYSDVSLGTIVLTASATDDDLTAANRVFEYTVSGTQLFGIDNNGNIFVFGSLTNYMNTGETFTISVSNPNTNNLSDSASVSIYIAEPDSDSFFDDGANIAWVTLLCLGLAIAIPALSYVGYRSCQKWGNGGAKMHNAKQVAPHDTEMPRSAVKERPKPRSYISTPFSVRTVVTPSDIRVIDRQWSAWKHDAWY